MGCDRISDNGVKYSVGGVVKAMMTTNDECGVQM